MKTLFGAVIAAVFLAPQASAQHSTSMLSEQNPTIPIMTPESGAKISFAGVAEVGSPVHDMIARTAGGSLRFPITYEISYSDPEGLLGFESVDELVVWAGLPESDSLRSSKKSFGSSTQYDDPGAIVGPPSTDGTHVGATAENCGISSWGPNNTMAQIRTSWMWMSQDQNGNGQHDAGETYDWTLVTYAVSYQTTSTIIEPC